MKIKNSEFKIEIQVAEEPHEKKRLPMLTRRLVASVIYVFCRINVVQG